MKFGVTENKHMSEPHVSFIFTPLYIVGLYLPIANVYCTFISAVLKKIIRNYMIYYTYYIKLHLYGYVLIKQEKFEKSILSCYKSRGLSQRDEWKFHCDR